MGIDHHKQYSHITVLDEKGEVIKTEKVWNTGREVREFLSGLDDEISGVVEAGYSHYTMMDLMESEGVSMKIAHPVKNRIRALLAKQREEVRHIVELEENLFKVSGIKVLGSLELPGRDQ